MAGCPAALVRRPHPRWAAALSLVAVLFAVALSSDGAGATQSPAAPRHGGLLSSHDGAPPPSSTRPNLLDTDDVSARRSHRRQLRRKKNRESRRAKKRAKRRKNRADQGRKRERGKYLHSPRREKVTPADLNLRWNALRNTWESTLEEDRSSASSHQIMTRSSSRKIEGVERSGRGGAQHSADTEGLPEDVRTSSVGPSIKFETYREDRSPFNSADVLQEDEAKSELGHSLSGAANLVDAVSPGNRSLHRRVERPRMATSEVGASQTDGRSSRRHLQSKREGPIIRSGYWSRRYSIKLPANYVSGRAARQSTFGRVDNFSGNLLNPFDQAVDGDSSATTARSTHGLSASSSQMGTPRYNLSEAGFASDHFSLSLNSTLSTPHYYRVLDTMSRPITPFNWRRPHAHRRTHRRPSLRHPKNVGQESTLTELEAVDEPRTEPVSSPRANFRRSDKKTSDYSPSNNISQSWAVHRNARSFRPSNNASSNAATASDSPAYNFVRLRPNEQKNEGAPESLYLRRRTRLSPSLPRNGPRHRDATFRPSTSHIPYREAPAADAHNTTEARSSAGARRPNIVVIITDDLDVELGSLNYMPRLQRLLREGGGLFPHSYTTTPMCCPSRSSMLTGMYIHNHEVYTNNDNCSSTRWQETHEQRTFATYLRHAGYNTGYFGKYLNKYKGPYTPAGWRDWMGLRLNSRYYNYTVFRNGVKFKYGDSYPRDYFPHVITHEGLRFMRENSARQHGFPPTGGGTVPRGPPPMLLVLSYPAPHGPEDAAPEHSTLFFNATDHHTVAYDYAPNPDKQWILQYTERMSPIKLKFTNTLMTKRLQTLQTVDLAIERIVSELARLRQLDNTYIFFTSDHGYHLGQFGLIKGKSMPFEFDVKVPLFVRGPGITPATEFPEIALNVDLAPTFLDIGGVAPPAHMDGRSLLPLLRREPLTQEWRHSFLIESSGRHRDEEVLEMKAQKRYQQLNRLLERQARINTTRHNLYATASLLDAYGTVPTPQNLSANSTASSLGSALDQLPLYTSKHEHLEVVCQSEQLQAPCTSLKKWHCQHDGFRWRLKKCRPRVSLRRTNCVCGPEHGMGYMVRLDSEERRRQRDFLKQHVSRDLSALSPRFLRTFVDVDSGEVARRNIRQRAQRRRSRIARNAPTAATADLEGAGEDLNVLLEEDFNSIPDEGDLEDLPNEEEVSGVVLTEQEVLGGDSGEAEDSVHAYVEEEELKDIERQIQDIFTELQDLEVASSSNTSASAILPSSNDTLREAAGGCVTVGGSRVDCPTEVYLDKQAWRSSKQAIDEEIRRLGHQMRMLKVIRQHLRMTRPRGAFLHLDDHLPPLDHSPEIDPVGSSVEPPTLAEVEEEGSSPIDSAGGLSPGVDMGTGKPGAEDEEGGGEVFDLSSEDDLSSNVTDPNHFSYTGGYRGSKTNRVAVYVPRQRSVCWCNKRVALQLHQQEQKLRRLEERQRLREVRAQRRKSRRDKKRKHKRQHKERPCNLSHQNCYHHHDTHWKTPPLWHDGSFCACLNSANNTYWCVRTINATHNTLYCEFITGLITYYDLNIDPYQLRNVAFMLEDAAVTQLHNTLTRLRSCRGRGQCDLLEDPLDEVPSASPDSEGTNARSSHPENPFLSHDSNSLSLFGSDEVAFDDLSGEGQVMDYEMNASNYHWNDFVELNSDREEEDYTDGTQWGSYNARPHQPTVLAEDELEGLDSWESEPSEGFNEIKFTAPGDDLRFQGRSSIARPSTDSSLQVEQNFSDSSSVHAAGENIPPRSAEGRKHGSSSDFSHMSDTDGAVMNNDVTLEHDLSTQYSGEVRAHHRIYRKQQLPIGSLRPAPDSPRRGGEHRRSQGGRGRSKKEDKKHRKELRRLRQEQKRRRLEQLLAEYARQQLNETSAPSGALERRRKRRLKRWRRLERRLQQMTASSQHSTSPSDSR